MSDHPYQIGTVWAPKRGKGALRRITGVGFGMQGLEQVSEPYVTYTTPGDPREYACSLKAFRRLGRRDRRRLSWRAW